ncbi:hypothetical protein P7C73_g3628, partial [Tremellales sp. Uapishka_1]
MSLPTEQKVWILSNPPSGPIESDTFTLETRPLPELQPGQVLVKAEILSNDPAQRTWMQKDTDERRLYAKPIRKGDVVKSYGTALVLKSTSEKWKEGQKVFGVVGWNDYAVLPEASFQSLVTEVEGQSEGIAVGLFGLGGLTAYFGVEDICKLKKEDTIVVSGAAGSVGSVVIQIAKKVIGCKKVIGIAGGKSKCDWVKSIGADDCVDYKDKDYVKKLEALLPDYAEVYFDNVGGEILNNMLPLVARFGKVAVCGAIANYQGDVLQMSNWREVIYNRLNIHGKANWVSARRVALLTEPGFILTDYASQFGKGREELLKWVKEGKIDNTDSETIVSTKIEDVPKTWQRLFEGANQGKLVTKLV